MNTKRDKGDKGDKGDKMKRETNGSQVRIEAKMTRDVATSGKGVDWKKGGRRDGTTGVPTDAASGRGTTGGERVGGTGMTGGESARGTRTIAAVEAIEAATMATIATSETKGTKGMTGTGAGAPRRLPSSRIRIL